MSKFDLFITQTGMKVLFPAPVTPITATMISRLLKGSLRSTNVVLSPHEERDLRECYLFSTGLNLSRLFSFFLCLLIAKAIRDVSIGIYKGEVL